MFTEQDIWQEPTADICSKTKVIWFTIINLKSTNICLKRQCVATFINYNK